jgi:hypothetical protein
MGGLVLTFTITVAFGRDASCRAALLVGQILPVFSLLAPCGAGASTPEYVTVIVKGST